MLLLIPLLPLLGFVANAALGRRLPKAVSGGLACLVMLASFGVSIAAVLSMRSSGAHAVQQTVFNWIPSGDLQIPFALRVDPLSLAGQLAHLERMMRRGGQRISRRGS